MTAKLIETLYKLENLLELEQHGKLKTKRKFINAVVKADLPGILTDEMSKLYHRNRWTCQKVIALTLEEQKTTVSILYGEKYGGCLK